jgi:hypothetical protein
VPKFLEDKLMKEYKGDKATVFKVMNSIGAVHGNVETAKGRAMEAKHERDTAAKPKASRASSDGAGHWSGH